MEVREVEHRYMSFQEFLLKRLKRWYRRNTGLIRTIIVALPLILLLVGALFLDLEGDKQYDISKDWEAVFIVVGGIGVIIEVAYIVIKTVYDWVTGLWKDYRREVWS